MKQEQINSIIRQPIFLLSQIVKYRAILKILYNMICLRFMLSIGATFYSLHLGASDRTPLSVR